MLKTELDQRGRASLHFLAAMNPVSGIVRAEVNKDIAAAGITNETVPEDLDERQAFMDDALRDSNAFGVIKLLGDWWCKYHGMMAFEAFEAKKDDIILELKRLDELDGPAELHLNPDLDIPAWWSDHWIHRTTGGWDGHAYMGYVHGEIIYNYMLTVVFGDVFKQRREAVAEAPKDHYKDILDMGASSGHCMVALQQTYPDAQLTGIDLSARMLENAYRVAKSEGWSWKLYQQNAADTTFEDNSFDLVTSYAVFHEVPEVTVRDILKEAYRLVRPGGDIVMVDVTRYSNLEPLKVWQVDYSATYSGEPFWRETALLDFADIAREVGFVDVKSVSGPHNVHPHQHYIIATKPAN